jgi:hypothetical protein
MAPFNDEQLAQLRQLIQDTVAATQAAPQAPAANAADTQRQINDSITAALNERRGNSGEDTKPPGWRDSEVGFFYPDLEPTAGDRDTVTVGSDTVIRDVHTFIDRLKDAAAYRGDAIVKERIPALLRGPAQM